MMGFCVRNNSVQAGGKSRYQWPDVHHGFAHVFARNHALFLGGEVFVCVSEQLEDFLDFVFFFGADVVFFG